MSRTSKPPIIFSPRWWRMLGTIVKEGIAFRRATKNRRSSGHLDRNARSAEFQRLRAQSAKKPDVTIVRTRGRR